MSDNIKIFNNEKFGEIRIIKDDNGNPLFYFNDICWALEAAPIEVKRRLDSDMVLARSVIIDGNEKLINFISEEGLYHAVTDKPDDKEFLEWITSEVLSSIRQIDNCDQVIDKTKTVECNEGRDMEELVFKSEKGMPVTNSLLVAQKFGKEHKNVLRDIKNLAAQNSAAKFFIECEYDNRGKKYPMFIMNRDGFSLLVMGFTGKDALKFKIDFIEAFNKMEETIKTGGYQIPKSYSEALMVAAKQAEQIEAQQKQLALQAPKVALMNKILDDDQKIDVGQAAKILSLPFGRNTLFARLREKGVFFKNRNEPKQEYIEKGYFELKEKWIDREYHDGFIVVKVLVTQRGLDFIARLFEVVSDKKQMIKIA